MKTYVSICFLFFSILQIAWAQPSTGFNYQAVVREGNEVLKNTVVSIQFFIHRGAENGPVSYQEVFLDTMTNEYGLLNLQIGRGIPESGRFDTLAWGAAPYFLEVKLKKDEAGEFIKMGDATEILHAPQPLSGGGRFVGIAPIFGFDEGAAQIIGASWQAVTRTQYGSLEGMFPQPVHPGTVRQYYLYIRKADDINECAENTQWRFWFTWANSPGHEFAVRRNWGPLKEGSYHIIETLPTITQIPGNNHYWRLEARIPESCPDREMRIFGIHVMAVDVPGGQNPALNLNIDPAPGISAKYLLGGGDGGILYDPSGFCRLRGQVEINLESGSGPSGRDGLIIKSSSDNTESVILTNTEGFLFYRTENRGPANVTARSLTITGGDVTEARHSTTGEQFPPGSVVIFDETQQGRVRLAETPYDKKVAGVISGAGKYFAGVCLLQEELAKGAMPVAQAGSVEVLAIGPIEVGDLLTSSRAPGFAMAAKNRRKREGAVIGKAVTSLHAGERGLVEMQIEKH